MVASIRRSYSSVSVNCSIGSEPGCAAASATRWATTPSSNVTPARAAGRTTASSSWAGDRGDSTNAPSPDVVSQQRVLERSVEHVGAHRRDHPHVRRVATRDARDHGQELVASVRRASRPALLELVDRPPPSAPCGGRRCRRRSSDRRSAAARPTPRDNASQSASTGASPGVMMATVYPSRRSRGTRPARTTELLPEPDAPTTVTNGRSATISASASTTSPRPKNAAGVGLIERAQPLVRVDAGGGGLNELPRRQSPSRVSGQPLVRGHRPEHAVGVSHRGTPRQEELGDRRVAALCRRRLGQHGAQPFGNLRHPPDQARRSSSGARGPRCARRWR